MADYIEGVDHLPERQVIDYTLNAYSDLFVDFLINVNCCIVNGRNSTADDYTFVSTRGCSVVDYCLTAYETLSRISNFKVLRASQLVQDSNSLGQVDIVQVFQYQDIADFIYVAISMLAVVIWLTISKA